MTDKEEEKEKDADEEVKDEDTDEMQDKIIYQNHFLHLCMSIMFSWGNVSSEYLENL